MAGADVVFVVVTNEDIPRQLGIEMDESVMVRWKSRQVGWQVGNHVVDFLYLSQCRHLIVT